MNEQMAVTPAPQADNRSNLSILVADDHNLVRSVLCAYLRTRTWGTVASAPTLDDALRYIDDQHFDILLLDLDMPGVDGYATVRSLAESLTETHVVIWSASLGPYVAMQCIEAGAKGFVPKDMNLDMLLPALNLVKSGETFLPGKYIVSMKQAKPTADAPRREISDAELGILRMIENGAQNKSIAIEIGKTETNVKAITRKIFLKIGAKNRAHAVHIAKMKGWM